MNAQDTAPPAAHAAFSNAARTTALLARLCGLHLAFAVATLLPGWVAPLHPAVALPAAPLLAGRAALILSLGALLATTLIAAARARTLAGHPSAVIRAAGSPQALLLCLAAALALATLRQAWVTPPSTGNGGTLLFPVILLLAAFLLLIGERAVAAIDPASLPEAAALSATMRLPVIVLGALALLAMLAPRLPVAGRAAGIAIVLLAAAAVETALRTLKVWYAPPPSAA